MKITSISKRGRTITLKGSFQRKDLAVILDAADKGKLTMPVSPHQLALELTAQVESMDENPGDSDADHN
jgi:hypothetical protein